MSLQQRYKCKFITVFLLPQLTLTAYFMRFWRKVEKLENRMQGIQCNYTNCYFNIS